MKLSALSFQRSAISSEENNGRSLCKPLGRLLVEFSLELKMVHRGLGPAFR